MLNIANREQVIAPARLADKEFETTGIDFERLAKAGRRQIAILVVFCLLSIVAGSVYLAHVVPRYTATAVVLIGSAKDKTGLSASIADLTYDAGAIDSQLEILKSEGLAQTVMTDLKLEDSSIPRQPPSLLKRMVDEIRTLLKLDPPAAEDVDPSELAASQRRGLITELEAGLDVRRIGRSYVIDIDYTSPDRLAAADFANAFARGYINDQLEARFASMKQASGWLEKRISELKQKSMSSDLAVQRFKSEHGLLTTDGRLVSDQQLSELSTQLIVAQGDRAKAEAKNNQISALIGKGDVKAVVSGTLESPVINDLRQKYLVTAQLQAQVADTEGTNHPQAITNLQRSMDDYSKLIFGEMTRIAAAYKSDAEVARAKEDSLRQSLAKLAGENNAHAQYMVELRELQREADSYRTLYTTFLDRMQQVEEGQTNPESEARVITPASPPDVPTYPKRGVVMSLSIVFGLLAGIGVAAVREYKDNTFRTAADVTEGLDLEFLGMLPTIKAPKSATRKDQSDNDPKIVNTRDPVLRYAVDQPLTSFAETLRTIKVAVDLQLGQTVPKIVGVISVSPDEGKSTVSKNFASLIAHFGLKVLLIDGDLHHPGLTQTLGSHAENGLLEVIRGDAALMDTVLFEPDSGLYFLPAILKERLSHANQSLASPGMRQILAAAGERFDYIIIDLPPIGPVVDVRASAAMFDAFVFVARWGRTVRDVVQTTLLADKEIRNRCIGVVYNRVQLDKIKLYEGSDSKAFYLRDFDKYYSS